MITFHSLEDRIVKHTLRALQRRRRRVHRADEAPGGADRGGDRTESARAAAPSSAPRNAVRAAEMPMTGDPSNTRSRRTSATTPSCARSIASGIVRCGVRRSSGLFLVAVLAVLGVAAFRAAGALPLARNACSDELAVEERQQSDLRARVEQLRSPKHLERLARERLGMVFPGPGEFEVIPRVTPSSPPPRSAVASR